MSKNTENSNHKKLCAINGVIKQGSKIGMCGYVIVGGELCGLKGNCEFQRDFIDAKKVSEASK